MYLSLQSGELYSIIKDLELQESSEPSTWEPQKSLRYVTYNGSDYFSRAELDRWIRFNINHSGM